MGSASRALLPRGAQGLAAQAPAAPVLARQYVTAASDAIRRAAGGPDYMGKDTERIDHRHYIIET